jgi:hypothetical protein
MSVFLLKKLKKWTFFKISTKVNNFLWPCRTETQKISVPPQQIKCLPFAEIPSAAPTFVVIVLLKEIFKIVSIECDDNL